VFAYFRRRRRRALRALPFPDEWRGYVDGNIPLFARLSADDQAEVLAHARVLLAEKHFEGCGGLELTDEIRVTIAVQAARLLLHRETEYFPTVRSILVYPSTMAHSQETHLGSGIRQESRVAITGLATGRMGAIILAWDESKRGLAKPSDGRDVILHEFAHEIDFQDRSFDGTPRLPSGSAYRAWARTMQSEFDAHTAAVDANARTFIDAYGATNPAEFFAVLTEHFFEQPNELRERHSALYERLSEFYRQDPAADGQS
jgi:Mlc titration factor MtfA (ptsG expression regulator)